MKFNVINWNDKKDKIMLIISEDEIINGKYKFIGFGVDILVLPNKFKENIGYSYLNNMKEIVLCRNGQIIYV